jgi:hypothetical protein
MYSQHSKRKGKEMNSKVCKECKNKLTESEVVLCAACEYDKECREQGEYIIE